MTSGPVDVVSLYGPVNAGVRARALHWLERLGTPARLTSYTGGAASGARDLLSHPTVPLRGEVRVRRLGRRSPDRLLLSREATPFGRGSVEARLLTRARHGVYDLDDALHLDVRGTAFEAAFSKRSTAERAAAAADRVIVGNDFLAEWARAFARDIVVIPTCVEPATYTKKTSFALNDPPMLVWLGTPSGEAYLASIGGALRELNRRHGARLTIVGSTRPSLGSLEELIDRRPWSLDFVHERLRDFDVGLMPLHDTLYERGKCAYKMLEYGAAGLPVVASPVGVNADVISAYGGPAPQNDGEWFDALVDLLIGGDGERAGQATRLHAVVSARFSFDAHERAWSGAVLG